MAPEAADHRLAVTMGPVTATARLVSATLLLMYVVFLAAVLTEYNPTVATDVVARLEAWLENNGAPAVMTGPGRVEFLLNAAMFAPIVFLAALTFPRHPWANWVVYAFIASAVVELFQGVYLPPRSATFVDVVANTLGGLVGAVASVPLSHALTRSGDDVPDPGGSSSV